MILGKGLQDKIKSIVLNLIDEKLGKRFPIIDEITDIFQGLEPRIKDLENKIKQIEERIDENINSKEKSSRDNDS